MPQEKVPPSSPPTPRSGNGKPAEARTAVAKMQGQLLSLRQLGGLHPCVPSTQGKTTVRRVPIPSPLDETHLIGGWVLITTEKPPRVLVGVDAYMSAVQQCIEARARDVFLPAVRVPPRLITPAFWRAWPGIECSVGRLDLNERTWLLSQLLLADHPAVAGRSVGDLAAMFTCSERTVKRKRQASERSRPYNGKKGKTGTEPSE